MIEKFPPNIGGILHSASDLAAFHLLNQVEFEVGKMYKSFESCMKK